MKSKAVLFQKEIGMETCWLILHSILVTHYWTALMDPAKQASDNMQSEVSAKDRVRGTWNHENGKD